MIAIKRILRYVYNKIRNLYVTILLNFLRMQNNKLTLGYDNNSSIDGTGAQLQRIIGIACLAEFLNVKYVNNGIKDVTIHPLDSFQDENGKNIYLEKINSIFTPISVTTLEDNCEKLILSKMSVTQLLVLTGYYKIKKKHLHIDIAEPYKIIDAYPKIYKLAVGQFKKIDQLRIKNEANQIQIVMHYRWGVGGGAIYHEQTISRELPMNHYLDILAKVTEEIQAKVTYKIIVLTDAPLNSMRYKPSLSQKHLWVDTPGFDEKYLNILGTNFTQLAEKYPNVVEIVSGGDPLDAIKIMVNADILLLSRSSLSYISALLNRNGQVFYPPNFWHPKLPTWT